MITLIADEIREKIAYDVICTVRYGVRWDTGRCRRMWNVEFSDAEKKAAGRLFRIANDWYLVHGIDDKVHMSKDTYKLWQKLDNFCLSLL